MTESTPLKIPRRATKADIAAALNISVKAVTDYIDRLSLKPDKLNRYATLSCYREYVRREADRERSRPHDTVDPGERPEIRTWADVEKSMRVRKLEIEIESLEGKMLFRADHLREIEEHAAIVISELANFTQTVAATVREPEAVKASETCVRNIRAKLAAVIRDQGETAKG